MTASPRMRYQTMEVGVVSGPRLVVLVYAHILAALRQGQRAIERKDHAARSAALCRARDLCAELAFTLDREAGAPIAGQLAQLYEYYIHEITQVDLHPDAGRLAKVTGLVATLHEAWEQAARQLAEPPAAATLPG